MVLVLDGDGGDVLVRGAVVLLGGYGSGCGVWLWW